MERGPVELVQADNGGSIGHQREDTLVLGCGSSVVERGTTILVTSVEVWEPTQVQNHINTLNVTKINDKKRGSASTYITVQVCSITRVLPI